MKSWPKEDAHGALDMESSSETIPTRPPCLLDQETEARW